MAYLQRLYDLFDDLVEDLGYQREPFRMYRPRGVNMEGYIAFASSTDAPFESHREAMLYYLTHVARPVSPPPRFTLTST